MADSPTRARRFRWRRLAQVVFVLGVLAVIVWQVRLHFSATDHLAQAHAALQHDDPNEARKHLDVCLERWPRKAEVHFLLARCARQSGDFRAALEHLAQADQMGHDAYEISLQRALIRAQTGYVREVELSLLKDIEDGRSETPQIAAVLVPLYTAEFRMVEANRLAAKWVEYQPQSVAGWTYRADILERLRRKEESIEALRQLVQLAPENRAGRLNLARMLLEMRQSPEEAAGHLEWLVSGNPNEVAVLLQLALCREAQSRVDESAAILDQLIAGPTKEAKAFQYRGRLELNRGRAAAAVPFFRTAAELDASDPEVLYALFQCLQQTGTPDEIRAAEDRWKRSDADLKRARDLAKSISAAPQDPEPRREIGELFLRNGRTADGIRWLESALRVHPGHAPTHQLLADHYERVGRADLARVHRLGAAKPK